MKQKRLLVVTDVGGRYYFERYSKIIGICFCVYRFIPLFFLDILFDIFSGRSKLSILNRYFYVKRISNVCGDNLYVGRFVTLKNLNNASFGDNVSIHECCYIDAVGGLVLGDNVSIAHNSSILTFNHTWGDSRLPIKYNEVELSPVVIEDDVWIGCGVRIMPGVTIGRRSVVAAGAVITRNVPPGSVVGGVPAKIIKEIPIE